MLFQNEDVNKALQALNNREIVQKAREVRKQTKPEFGSPEVLNLYGMQDKPHHQPPIFKVRTSTNLRERRTVTSVD